MKSHRTAYEKHTAEFWNLARHQYEGGRPIAEICRTLKVSESTVYCRVKSEGWQRLTAMASATRTPEDAALMNRDSEAPVIVPGPAEPDTGQTRLHCAPDVYESNAILQRSLNQEHLRIAGHLRSRISELTCEVELGASTHGRVSRAAVDLASALEKLQKIERTALAQDTLDERDQTTHVIILPAMLSETEWRKAAQDYLESKQVPADYLRT